MAGEKLHGGKTRQPQRVRIIARKDGPNVVSGGGARIRTSPAAPRGRRTGITTEGPEWTF